MTRVGVIGTFIRVGDHELLLLAPAATAALSQSAILVSDYKPQFTAADNTTIMSSLQNVRLDYSEPVVDDHINGDLRYLYRSVKIHNPRVVRRRHPIKQPCWRRGRWKSLT